MRMVIAVRRTVPFLAFLIALGACQPSPDRTSTAATAEVPDLASEEQAIRDAEQRWREMMRRKDTAAIGGFYTEDAVYAPEDRPPARGRDAVAAMWATNELTL